MILIALLVVALGFTTIYQLDLLSETIAFFITAAAAIVKIILMPFTILFETFVPQFDVQIVSIMFQWLQPYVAWLMNSLFIPKEGLILIIAYYTMTMAVGFGVWMIKLLPKWKNALF